MKYENLGEHYLKEVALLYVNAKLDLYEFKKLEFSKDKISLFVTSGDTEISIHSKNYFHVSLNKFITEFMDEVSKVFLEKL